MLTFRKSLLATAIVSALITASEAAQAAPDCTVVDYGPGVYTVGANLDSEVGCAPAGTNKNVSGTVTGATVTVNNIAQSRNGISSETAGNNPGGVNITVIDSTVNNKNNTSPSIGIAVTVGDTTLAGTRDGILTLKGANTVTVTNGGGILVNVRGQGDGTATITGTLKIDNNSDKNGGQDALEVTTRYGKASLDMNDVEATINVKGGNGIFVDALEQTAGNRIFGGGEVYAEIGADVTVNLTNDISGAAGHANAGIRVSTTTTTVAGAGGANNGLRVGNVTLISAATVNTTGDKANGITATADTGTIDLTNTGNIDTTGNNSSGIEAGLSFYPTAQDRKDLRNGEVRIGEGDITIDTSAEITTAGLNSYGIRVATNGTIDLTNTGEVTADQSIGVLVDTETSLAITITNQATGNITGTLGVKAGSATHDATPVITLNNSGGITGTTSYGVEVLNPIDATNSGTIEGETTGLSALYGGSVKNELGGSITGVDEDGIFAGKGITITSYGTLRGAVNAVQFTEGNNTLNLKNQSETFGILLMGKDSDITTVFTGANIAGVTRFDNGTGVSTLVFDGYQGTVTEISSSSANSADQWEKVHVINNAALTFNGNTKHQADLFQIDDGSISITGAAGDNTLISPKVDLGDAGALIFNHSSASYSFTAPITGTGKATDAVQQLAGITILIADNTYSSGTKVNGGTLRAGGVNKFSPNSAVVVNTSGIFDLNGFDQTIKGLNNGGVVRFNSTGTGATFKPTTLTVNGDYVGNGGTLYMKTFLAGDASPTDKMVVFGNVTGTTSKIEVTNVGGAGALTNTGILLVDIRNGGTSPAEAFKLTGGGDPGAGEDAISAY
ncbi:MAG: hypothetical protein LBF16_14020, partial [Pseudomonadales bacterium]|nr:hypothetical protein [Pseudomonadales bacterium]